jgi:dienelactone hydrolase
VDGNDFWLKGGGGEALLKGVIARAQASSHALPGKAGVVGFSLGGASTLVYGTHMPEQVAAVVLHYPATSYITRPAFVVARIQVPTLMMAGTSDTYKNCCLIDTARALAEAAKAGAAPQLFELHEYPGAEHGFNTNGSRDRFTAIDSTQRTVAWLKQHMAVDAKAAASAPK